MRNQEFLILPPEDVARLLSSDELNVPSEETIFHALVLWAKHDTPNRRKHLAKLLAHIKLPLMAPQVRGREGWAGGWAGGVEGVLWIVGGWAGVVGWARSGQGGLVGRVCGGGVVCVCVCEVCVRVPDFPSLSTQFIADHIKTDTCCSRRTVFACACVCVRVWGMRACH